MGTIASQITSLTIVYSIIYSDAYQNKTSKLRATGLCAGNSPGTGEFPAQMASNAENVSIWWRHHVRIVFKMLHYNNFRWYWRVKLKWALFGWTPSCVWCAVACCSEGLVRRSFLSFEQFHGANMGPTWVLSAPYGPHVGPINLAVIERFKVHLFTTMLWLMASLY